jgi:hypothetical protein
VPEGSNAIGFPSQNFDEKEVDFSLSEQRVRRYISKEYR